MPIVNVRDLGAYGVVVDRPSHELPPNAWNNLRNVRAKDKFLEPVRGEEPKYEAGTVVSNPMNLFYCPTVSGLPYWLYAGRDGIGACNDLGHSDISPSAPAISVSDQERWTGTWMNGIFVLNSIGEEMLVWDDIDPTTPVATKRMSTIASTEFQAGWRFNAVRAFKEILIGIGFNDGSTDFPTTIKWSGPATAGNVPIEWDSANLNNIANDQPLSATPGKAVDGAPLGNNFIVCKEDATIRVAFTQGASPLSFNYIDNTSGVIGVNCMTEFRKGQMVILNQNLDVMVTDGTYVDSILSSRLRDDLVRRVNPLRLHQCFVVNYPIKKEVWICYPTLAEEDTAGELSCQEALIWNHKDNTFFFHDLGRVSHINFGRVDTAGSADVINSVDVLINQYDSLIDSGGLEGGYALMGCSWIRDNFFQMDYGPTIDGNALVCTMERFGLALTGYDENKAMRVDHHSVKVVDAVWPTFEIAGTDVVVDISLGAQEYRDGGTEWDGPYTFNPRTQQEMDFFMEGIYISTRFVITSAEYWKFHTYGVNMELAGDLL